MTVLSAATAAIVAVLAAVVGFLLWCPILKPWFGFRKPPDHKGHWFQ